MTVQNVPPLNGSAAQPQRLVLLGSGHTHLHVLASLAKRPLGGVKVILVSPHTHQTHPAMLPGFVAGLYPIDDCAIALEPLARRAGVRWLQRSAKALDADQKVLTLDDGSTLAYDWLSVNTGATQNREQFDISMPGARTHGLFIRPIEVFVALWPKVVEMGAARALRIAVVGAGATGIELACAVRKRLPHSAITLLAGPMPPAAQYPGAVQAKVQTMLKKKGITVLQEVVTSIDAHEVRLGCGASLACDVPLIAIGVQPPAWLKTCTLDLDTRGYIAVNQFQQSTSHPHVFASGDVRTRADRPLARSASHAARAGKSLLYNLQAALVGTPLKEHIPPAEKLNILSCGSRYAIGSWGTYSIQGHWLWWLKHWMDRLFIAKFRSK